MSILFWPTPGLKSKTFYHLRVLNGGDVKFCVRNTQLREWPEREGSQCGWYSKFPHFVRNARTEVVVLFPAYAKK